MTLTHEGGTGFARTPKGELYLRATTMFAGQDSFYEKAGNSDDRAKELAKNLAVTDWEWFSGFLPWLRSTGNIRTMSMILAVEGVRARLNSKIHGTHDHPVPMTEHGEPVGPGINITDLPSNRKVIDSVLQRPDEPGKLIKYHFSNYGKDIPKPIKRGVADALTRMLNQRQALRYDKPGDEIRLGDVIELTHPKAKNQVQGALFEHLITSRHDREGYEPPVILDEIRARWELEKMSPEQRHAFAHEVRSGDQAATQTWGKALAGSWEWGKLWLGEK